MRSAGWLDTKEPDAECVLLFIGNARMRMNVRTFEIERLKSSCRKILRYVLQWP